MKILLVEDEAKTASYLRNGLVENSCLADMSASGDDGLPAMTARAAGRRCTPTLATLIMRALRVKRGCGSGCQNALQQIDHQLAQQRDLIAGLR